MADFPATYAIDGSYLGPEILVGFSDLSADHFPSTSCYFSVYNDGDEYYVGDYYKSLHKAFQEDNGGRVFCTLCGALILFEGENYFRPVDFVSEAFGGQ